MNNFFRAIFSPKSVVILILCALSLFSIGSWFNYLNQKRYYDDLYQRISGLAFYLAHSFQHRNNNELAKKFYQHASTNLIEDLSTDPLLQGEKTYLENLFSDAHYFGNPSLENRYVWLQQNHSLQLYPIDFHSSEDCRETVFSMDGVVEVDMEDVARILSVLETPHPQAPQYIIKECTLHKKLNHPRDTFYMQLKVLQREYS